MKFLHCSPALLLFAVSVVYADATQNPPPTRPLEGYSSYELRPLELVPVLASDAGKVKAMAQIQSHVAADLDPLIQGWNQAAKPDANPAKLVMSPQIEQLKEVSGGARFWGGAFAGSSYVLIRLKVVEEPGDLVIAEPEFYQRAAAMSGAWTVGGQDKAMLGRIVGIMKDYLSANYPAAVGGPTGRPAK
jgi:hypothetical protein